MTALFSIERTLGEGFTTEISFRESAKDHPSIPTNLWFYLELQINFILDEHSDLRDLGTRR